MAIDWKRLRALATRQHDVLTRRQCLGAGMTARAVQWRVRSGRWVRLHPGVFLTKPGRDDWPMRATAALLSVDSGGTAADAALCGSSAAYLWGLNRNPPREVEVVVPYAKTVAVPRGSDVAQVVALGRPRPRDGLPMADHGAGHGPRGGDEGERSRRAELGRAGSAATADDARRAPSGNLGARRTPPQSSAEAGACGRRRGDGERGRAVVRPQCRTPARAPTFAAPGAVGRRARTVGMTSAYNDYRLLVEVDGRLGHEGWSERVRDGQRDRQLLTTERATTRVFWTGRRSHAVCNSPRDSSHPAVTRLAGNPSPLPSRRLQRGSARVFEGFATP